MATPLIYDSLSSRRSWKVAIAALYAPGAPRSFEPKRRNWKAIDHLLRRESVLAESLTRNGLYQEALLLGDPSLLDWASEHIDDGSLLTIYDDEFPERWLLYLNTQLCPAIWQKGIMPREPSITIVGSRRPSNQAASFAQRLSQLTSQLGFSLASGGAVGVDSIVSSTSNLDPQVIIVPQGLATRQEVSTPSAGPCFLSLCEPNAPFQRLAALERNAYLYAISEVSIVIEPRFKEGGSWHGAVDALKRRLSRVLVYGGVHEDAANALIGIGAGPLDEQDLASPQSLLCALGRRPPQLILFP